MEEDVKKILEDHEKRISALENLTKGSKSLTPSKAKSLKEFIIEKNPKSDVNKTLSIAYYLEKFENQNLVTSKDIAEGYRRAKEKVPKNVTDMIQKNIAKGFMEESDTEKENQKAWYITNSGERFVENDFKT